MGMSQPMFDLQAEVNNEHNLWAKNIQVSQVFCAQNESLCEWPSMMEIVLVLQSIKDTFLGTTNSEANVSIFLNSSSTTSNKTSKSQSSSTS